MEALFKPFIMSILRYPGGKFRAIKKIMLYIPEECEILVSPFFGVGSIELACAKQGIHILANDQFDLLIIFWRQLQEDKEAVMSYASKLQTLNQKDFYGLRDMLAQGELPLTAEAAATFFAINRSSFSWSTLSGGFSRDIRFTMSSIQRLSECDLSNFRLVCLDFEQYLDSVLVDAGTFIYADLPYALRKNSNLYGTKGDLHQDFDHKRLRDVLITKRRWIFSYNDCSEIRNLYLGYSIVSVSWTYSMGTNKKSSEILIFSTDIIKWYSYIWTVFTLVT